MQNKLFSSIIVDFWIPSANIVVEVHGKQHYTPSGFGKSEIETLKAFQHQISRDARLRDACRAFNLIFIEISYNDTPRQIYRKILNVI